ncbi:MAG: tRNA lysidine(34) synthetase TilS [Bacteroidales bacterium]|nr:tRNA lysidine(34) synthetase TilS [Bacteroidales bacterium]
MRGRFDKCLDRLLPENGAVLLAVSGGIDSMVMADLFLNSHRGIRISLAHCNFHLRGEESDSDESFVRDWAETQGIPFHKTDFDTLGYASSHGISVEMAARELRYEWFASLAEKEGFGAVAVAHNANDNAETLLLNLLRGTGLKGICGMRESSTLPGSSVTLIRPLLGFSRDEIKEYAVAQGLRWREDSTNADSSYKRNLIRNEVFPLFEKVNPSFLNTLEADMRRFSQVQAIADDFFSENRLAVDGNKINVDDLLRSPHWEYLLFRLLEPYGFNEAVIGDMAGLIKCGKTFSGRVFRSSTHIARTSRNSIIISESGDASLCDDEAIVVTGPGEYVVGGVGLKVEVAEVENPKRLEGVSAVNLAFPFVVRLWRPGDWMRPLGMGGRRKKLSDMFSDLKFSQEQKERALVIAGEGSHVLSLLGYRVDESVALLDLKLEREPGEHQLAVTLRPGPLPIQ